jgi:DNA-binding LacI/PurR family transcriptional regulator
MRMATTETSTRARVAVRRATTLQDVATAAGVSLMTVSNVVNRKSNAVGENTRARVEREIKRLNYRPHASGRSLRLAHQWSVGMIIIHESDSFLADPFVTQVVAGLNKEMSLNGYGLFLQGIRKDELKSSVLIKNAGTDGLCAFYYGTPRERRDIAETLAALGQPLILIQEPLAFPGKDVCCIREDDYQGGRMLAEHLVSRSARRFVVLEPSFAWPALSERRRGVQSVLKDLSGASMTTVTCGNGEFASTQAALAAHLDSSDLPHAIMANDHIAIAAMKLLAKRGISVPQDVLVTGFNGFEFWQYTDPMLTTIRSPAFDMGRRAGREMLHRLEHGTFSAAKFVLPVVLQEGGST